MTQRTSLHRALTQLAPGRSNGVETRADLCSLALRRTATPPLRPCVTRACVPTSGIKAHDARSRVCRRSRVQQCDSFRRFTNGQSSVNKLLASPRVVLQLVQVRGARCMSNRQQAPNHHASASKCVKCPTVHDDRDSTISFEPSGLHRRPTPENPSAVKGTRQTAAVRATHTHRHASHNGELRSVARCAGHDHGNRATHRVRQPTHP